jgi:hypothetical protein
MKPPRIGHIERLRHRRPVVVLMYSLRFRDTLTVSSTFTEYRNSHIDQPESHRCDRGTCQNERWYGGMLLADRMIPRGPSHLERRDALMVAPVLFMH